MKNKIIIKSRNILSFDEQIKKNKPKTSLSLEEFMEEYFRGKISPERYLYLTKVYKE
jgi:hypothetical protein